ncbi:MAG: GUN4 domain-containing protein [Okeania sp. SIO2G4]|uniref:GUN4 domain-containing protein n=1 Tax=unclassified Okeania TaxID=2634635 RepID=UPI0013BB9861|nr:GUN4 domain-containing protein [Okeania sp. SIO4D6]NEP38548.1 GUN4 domain-containing protein [Okeania sp. SIO2H7]NEP72759.1 GUN4 domain-containing protein [Okeania sp. SIO2G5]NEP93394.1 GUN4 domain-containing protein [Okeania sp. SIO2F5]NEQ91406.1 GUN4 domain-containing protein [Okeania sp. SIO2G4]
MSDESGKILDGLVQQKQKQRYQNVEDVLAELGLGNSSVYHTQNNQLSPKYSSASNVRSANIYRFATQSNTSVYTTHKNQQPSQNFAFSDVPLVSAKGLDYTNLRDLLAAGKWKEADKETEHCMLIENINYFPCEDLRTIDQLWVKYSNGKFGFSVQKQIYQGLGGTRQYNNKIWEVFGDRVGWRQGGKRLYYSELTFSLDTAYTGHLLVRIVWGGV